MPQPADPQSANLQFNNTPQSEGESQALLFVAVYLSEVFKKTENSVFPVEYTASSSLSNS